MWWNLKPEYPKSIFKRKKIKKQKKKISKSELKLIEIQKAWKTSHYDLKNVPFIKRENLEKPERPLTPEIINSILDMEELNYSTINIL